ncbi:molybdopterin-dependent oxidoreductase [Halorubrum sp. AD140]|uniref:molybdopterin-dependent oxidoreductase n=1 Tax=Halorubrum sp. AD140 TaxID=3050073 RepID=UPI002ACC4A7E|nr:molybdopterin-dependent oxidoreductase [Halorubrum sp. AD140]MDZ5812092.1 molybdopterin-dependent oxidoreductase [Halorubrum sp. AD140]
MNAHASRPDEGLSRPDAQPIALADVDLTGVDAVERSITVRCATGRRSEAAWRGPPIAAVVERAAFPAETTHLVATSADGHRACLAVSAVLDGVLAVERDGTPIAEANRPRLVAPGIEGARTVKGVVAIEPLSLAPGEDPEEFEALPR